MRAALLCKQSTATGKPSGVLLAARLKHRQWHFARSNLPMAPASKLIICIRDVATLLVEGSKQCTSIGAQLDAALHLLQGH